MSETETAEKAATPDVFDGDSVSSDPEWQTAMDGGEADEGEATETGAESATEQSEATEAETGQEDKGAAVETAETAEKPAEGEAAESEEQKPSPQVPIQALHQERDKRQALERQLAELKSQVEEITKPPAPVIDRDTEVRKLMESGELTEVEAEIRFDQEQIKQEQAEAKEFRKIQQEQQAKQNEINTVQAQYSTAATKFAEKQTDFNDAYNFALNARATQLRFEHPDATDAQINNSIYISEINLAASAIKAGKDPAETVYEYAKTFGYQGPKGDDNGAAGKNSGETDAEKKLLNIQKGEEASRSASSGGAGDTGDGLTFDSLKNKKGKEFDQGWNELVPRNNDIFNI